MSQLVDNLIGVVIFGLLLWALATSGGCGYNAVASNHGPDAGASVESSGDPAACRIQGDCGKEIYWIFMPDRNVNILTTTPTPYGSRYVCKDHGKGRGVWWEQER